jgi:hypothetical protein
MNNQGTSQNPLTPNAIELREVGVLESRPRRVNFFSGAIAWKWPEANRHAWKRFDADKFSCRIWATWLPFWSETFYSHA